MEWPAAIWTKSDAWVRTFKDIEKDPVYRDWLNGVIFSLALGLIDMIIELPLSLYNQFSIEEQHGFNKQTLGGWVKDIIKVIFLQLII